MMLDLALRRLPEGVMVHLFGQTFFLTEKDWTELIALLNYFGTVDEAEAKGYQEWQAELKSRRVELSRDDLVKLGLLRDKPKIKIERRI